MVADQRMLLYSESEARATLGGLGRTTMHRLCEAGALEKVRIGRRVFITGESLEAYVAGLSDKESGDNLGGDAA